MIHPTAIVHPTCKIGKNVTIGPYAIVEAGATLGDGTVIHSHAFIGKKTVLGQDNVIHMGAVIGQDPQYNHAVKGESHVQIGDRNIFREYVTVHRGLEAGASTRIGNDNFFSNYELVMDLQPIPVFCLAGEHDIITPMKIYRRSAQFNEKNDVRYFSIPGGGHFPWVENFQEVSSVLQRAEKAVSPAPSR